MTTALTLLVACDADRPTAAPSLSASPRDAPAPAGTSERDRPPSPRAAPSTAASAPRTPTNPSLTAASPTDVPTTTATPAAPTPAAQSSTPEPPPPSPAPADQTQVEVTPASSYPAATIAFAGESYAGVVGRNGVSDDKREGDGTTPAGCFRILKVYYRPDRLAAPTTVLPTQALEPDDVWIDDPEHPRYNQPAKASDIGPDVSHEVMWRDDHRYDIVLDLDYNRSPVVPRRGSAIFLHVAYDQSNPASTPTAGCVALAQANLLEILARARADTEVCVRL